MMSLQNVQSIINRALSNSEYQELLFEAPEEAYHGYELTDSEKSMLGNLASGPYTTARRGLIETRKLVIAALEYDIGGEIE